MPDINEIYLMDCMEGMKQFPDKYFELAIVDPPYGIGEDGTNNKNKSRNKAFGSHSFGAKNSRKTIVPAGNYAVKKWDVKPNCRYFEELKRVSKNQIIWGGNYFNLSPSSCWIVWDKDNSGDFADCELAYTSFTTAVRKFEFRWNGMLQGDMKNREKRIHPTQKPTALYKWLLKNYAKPGDKILDTHGGSFSSVIACLEMGFEYIAFEIDEEYYRNGLKRIETYLKQPKIFTPEQIQPKQLNLL
jgi:site-specific DNA-methyltransferase (adenine-specific)